MSGVMLANVGGGSVVDEAAGVETVCAGRLAAPDWAGARTSKEVPEALFGLKWVVLLQPPTAVD